MAFVKDLLENVKKKKQKIVRLTTTTLRFTRHNLPSSLSPCQFIIYRYIYFIKHNARTNMIYNNIICTAVASFIYERLAVFTTLCRYVYNIIFIIIGDSSSVSSRNLVASNMSTSSFQVLYIVVNSPG